LNNSNNSSNSDNSKDQEDQATKKSVNGFPWLYCSLLYGLALAAIFAEKMFHGFIFAAEDGRVQNYPAFASPGFLWTPLLLTGFPVLADPQTSLFYPICFISKHLFQGNQAYQGWNLYVLSAYFLSALFAALFAYRLTKSRLAAMIAGIIYGFGGYQISELRHIQIIQTAVWLPLLLYFVEVLRLRTKWATLQLALMAGTSALTILAGHPQTAAYIFAATLAYAAFGNISKRATSKKENIKQALIVTVLSATAILFGAAIAAVQLLPSYELSQQSVRTTFGYKDFLVGELEPLQILGFIMPYLLGGKFGSLEGLPFSEQGPPPGLLFFGFAPIVLSIFAMLRLRTQAVVPYLIATIVLSFLFALGAHTPLARLFHAIPILGSFRGLYRILLLPAFAISILSAVAIAKIESQETSSDRVTLKEELLTNWQKLGKWKHIALCLYTLVGALVPTFLLGTLPLLLYKSRPQQLWRKALLLGSIFAVIFSYAVNSQWFQQSPPIAQFSPPSGYEQLKAKLQEKNQRIFTLRGLAADKDEYPVNLSRLWGVSNASGYEPLMPRRYMKLLGIAEGGFLQPPWRIKAQDRCFDICAVRYLLAPADAFGGRAFVDDAWKHWKLVSQSDGVLCYENTRARPRFYLVAEHKDVSEQEALIAIKTSALPNGAVFDPETMVLIETEKQQNQTHSASTNETSTGASEAATSKPEAAAHAAVGASISAIEIDKLTDEQIELSTESDFSGYLVVADQYYPGWKASLDGQATPILKANYVQRAITLPAGKHKAVFTYEPESYRSGLLISSAALALLTLTAIIGTIKGLKT
jgi:hypothetical protein